jgi:squalene synthase HpnC
LVAFRQDQRQTRYTTFEDLLDYCRYSANPVGRLVLYLGRSHDLENVGLSDSICTGLQLANFCQDVARDFDRGRIYLPQESCRRFRYGEEMFPQRQCNDCFRELLAFEVQRAESYLTAGWPLVKRVSRQLRFDVELFIRGGLAILQAIRQQHYDVWSRRPTLGRWAKFWLMWSTWRGLPGTVDDPAATPPGDKRSPIYHRLKK